MQYSFALPFGSAALISTFIVFWTEAAIMEAMNRCQMRRYSLYWSELREPRTSSGVSAMFVGRMASWPSCALLRCLK